MTNKFDLSFFKNFFFKNFFWTLKILFSSFIFFLILYFLKRYYFPADIIYNEGIFVSFIATLLFLLPLFLKKHKYCFTLFILIFLMNYNFIATFPTLINRSISIMILKTIEKEQKINLKTIKSSFDKNYSSYNNFFQVEKRIEEQLKIKNIKLTFDNNYSVTKKGKFFIKFTDYLSKLFRIERDYKF